jgi:triosephosphate isomerase
MRRRIIAGNWKMNKSLTEAIDLATSVRDNLHNDRVDVVLCPPFTNLAGVFQVIKESPIALGAQNLFWEKSGAYTGEVSAGMLKAVGCSYVIIGHSERRQYFFETDETVNKKIKAALDVCLVPIFCVGERLEERQAGDTDKIVDRQVRQGLTGLTAEQVRQVVIAYEPVWAIGTGVVATPDQAQQVHAMIRALIGELYNNTIAANFRIQYGGSMKPDNAGELLSQPDIDGGLIGGASLTAEAFLGIVNV